MRPGLTKRATATLVTALALAFSAPGAAFAAEVENPWSRWAAEVLDRPTKAEIPLALIVSFPGMLVITPIWLGKLAVQALSGD